MNYLSLHILAHHGDISSGPDRAGWQDRVDGGGQDLALFHVEDGLISDLKSV